jgi:hypothetical protein
MTQRDSHVPVAPKRSRGRTSIDDTPITTRSRVPLAEEDRRGIEARLKRALAPFGPRIERATIRFEDVNGPRHGVGMRCSIKVVFSGSDSIIVEERATNVLETARLAIPRVARSVRRYAGQSGFKTPRPTHRRSAAPRAASAGEPAAAEPFDPGSLIGKRVGRGKANLAAALERPEKLRRDALVDTAQPGVSATDRKAGGGSTARRNSKQSNSGMTSALEDSRSKPSRKSTRGGTNRTKGATQLTRRAQRKVRSPQARAERGK